MHKLHYLIILAIIGCGESILQTEIEKTDTLIVQDTFYVRDTLEVRPEFSYRKVQYIVSSDTGACNVNLWTEVGKGYFPYLDTCELNLTLFYKDSVYRHESVVLRVMPDYDSTIAKIQTLRAYIYVDDVLRTSDTVYNGEEWLGLIYRF